jgi:hypothetical protein
MQIKSIYEYPRDEIDFDLENRQGCDCGGELVDGEYEKYGWTDFSFYNIKGKSGCLMVSMSMWSYRKGFIIDLKNNIAYTKNNQNVIKDAKFFSVYYPFCFGI